MSLKVVSILIYVALPYIYQFQTVFNNYSTIKINNTMCYCPVQEV